MCLFENEFDLKLWLIRYPVLIPLMHKFSFFLIMLELIGFSVNTLPVIISMAIRGITELGNMYREISTTYAYYMQLASFCRPIKTVRN